MTDGELTVIEELVGTLYADNTLSGSVETAINPAYALRAEAGAKIELFINEGNYKVWAKLRDKDDNVINTSNEIDLPIETMVVNGEYDDSTKSIILTLDNGNTVTFSVADLVAGLQTELSSTNKLRSDYVDDTNQTNKFVTTSEKNTWNAKVGTTDYANGSIGGVFKTSSGYGTEVNVSGYLRGLTKDYANYSSGDNATIISKGTLENVITGKGLVSNTDYATSSVAGVITPSNTYGTNVSATTGTLYGTTYTYADYQNKSTNMFVSKGTLNNVLAATVGDIDSVLDAINGEVIS